MVELNLLDPPRIPVIPVVKHYFPTNTVFLLQIVSRDGTVARIPGGGRFEEDLIVFLRTAILARLRQPKEGFWLFRWLAAKFLWGSIRRAVERAVDEGIRSSLSRFKDKTRRVA